MIMELMLLSDSEDFFSNILLRILHIIYTHIVAHIQNINIYTNTTAVVPPHFKRPYNTEINQLKTLKTKVYKIHLIVLMYL